MSFQPYLALICLSVDVYMYIHSWIFILKDRWTLYHCRTPQKLFWTCIFFFLSSELCSRKLICDFTLNSLFLYLYLHMFYDCVYIPSKETQRDDFGLKILFRIYHFNLATVYLLIFNTFISICEYNPRLPFYAMYSSFIWWKVVNETWAVHYLNYS